MVVTGDVPEVTSFLWVFYEIDIFKLFAGLALVSMLLAGWIGGRRLRTINLCAILGYFNDISTTIVGCWECGMLRL